jgi:hypothetical protein
MDLIKNYEKACYDIAEHVGYKDGCIQEHVISTEFINCFFSSWAGDSDINWSENKEDVEELDGGGLYSSECKGVYRGTEITLALIRSDFGDDDYWIVFKTENEIK